MVTKPNQALVYRKVPPFLRSLREAAGLTQRDLAKRLRQSQAVVHKSETGSRRVDIAEFMEWCVGCGVDPTAAFDGLKKLRR